MRLGAYPCRIVADSIMERAYGKSKLQSATDIDMSLTTLSDANAGSGINVYRVLSDGKLVEAVEIPENDFFIGVQFHPEFKAALTKRIRCFAVIAAAMK